MIRIATYKDAEPMAKLGESVVTGEDKTLMAWELMPDILMAYLANPNMRCLVDDDEGRIVAALTGTISAHPWNPDLLLGYVLSWWSSKRGRGRAILNEFRAWARDEGATMLLVASRDERTERTLDRMGLPRIESNHLGGV